MIVTRSPLGPRGKAESSDPPSSVEVDSIVVVSDGGAGPGAGGLAVVGAGPGAVGPGLAVVAGTVAGLCVDAQAWQQVSRVVSSAPLPKSASLLQPEQQVTKSGNASFEALLQSYTSSNSMHI